MGLIGFTNIVDGTTIDGADVNTPLNTIYNEFNGNIDATNMKDGAAVTNAKLSTSAGELGGSWASSAATLAVSGGTVPTYATNEIRKHISGKTVTASYTLENTTGGTAGAGSNPLYITLPYAAASTTRIGYGSIYNGGVLINGKLVSNFLVASSVGSNMAYLTADGSYNISGADQSNPNRYIYITITYETI